jgi:hypothetical protein
LLGLIVGICGRDREIIAFKSKGCILGKVTSIQSNMARDDRQGIDVIFKNIPGQPEEKGEWSAHWTLPVSARPIRKEDFICLLQGASKPMIVRLCNDYFAIIMIAATPQENISTKSRHMRDQHSPNRKISSSAISYLSGTGKVPLRNIKIKKDTKP